MTKLRVSLLLSLMCLLLYPYRAQDKKYCATRWMPMAWGSALQLEYWDDQWTCCWS